MDSVIKSGQEILNDFFDSIEKIPGVDNSIALTVKELYRDNKLTSGNLANALFKQRENAAHDQN